MEPSANPSTQAGINDAAQASFGPGFNPWSWNDASSLLKSANSVANEPIDFNIELDGEINWLDWLESTKGVD